MKKRGWRNGIAVVGVLALAGTALGNGGPFVLKYPKGDPAAKGVLARIDRSLLPARETQLEVVKEDLTITYAQDDVGRMVGKANNPLVHVVAEYTIKNPSKEMVKIDFGFPILRGIYIPPMSMMPRPDAQVQVDGKYVKANIINNSTIYGMIRSRARKTIEAAIEADPIMAGLVGGIREHNEARDRVRRTLGANKELSAKIQVIQPKLKVGYFQTREMMLDYLLGGLEADAHARKIIDKELKADSTLTALAGMALPLKESRDRSRKGLEEYVTKTLGWNERDTALMVEYASIDFSGTHFPQFHPSPWFWGGTDVATELGADTNANMGALGAIGEKKATQFLALLSAKFSPEAAAGYEKIFTAWGGDVRERSVDLSTGEVRPREIDVKKQARKGDASNAWDPSIYARVEYFEANYPVPEDQKASCKRILKNLPVIFTFAPMNLLHYHVKFTPGREHTVRVSYKQYAYTDTREPESYQLSYVVHPASLWKKFGPINLKIGIPEKTRLAASTPCRKTETKKISTATGHMTYAVYSATLKDKTGELFTGVDAGDWKAAFQQKNQKPVRTAKK